MGIFVWWRWEPFVYKSLNLIMHVFSNQVEALQKAMGTVFSHVKHASSPAVIVFQSPDDWEAHFHSSKKTNRLLVVDFKAVWCGPCRSMKPIFSEFASKYKDVEFVEIDVDKLNDVAEKFGVREMPTFLLIKQGKVIDKVVGARKNELQEAIEKHM